MYITLDYGSGNRAQLIFNANGITFSKRLAGESTFTPVWTNH